MRLTSVRFCLLIALFPCLTATMCNTTSIMTDDTVVRIALSDFAVNTNGASGLAVRPSDGAVFAVNGDGLFGPIKAGDDLSKLTPFGATNLASTAIFGEKPDTPTLAITTKGEFWIGAKCCQTLAVVPATGGNATAFTGLPANIKPDTMVIVPTGFDGTQMHPTNLLVGEDVFSRLAAIAVDTDRKVVSVDNPDVTQVRNGLHMAFGPQPLLYAGRGTLDPTLFGIETVDTTGRPTGLTGTQNASAKSFVVLSNLDMVIRGSFKPASGSQFDGLYLFRNSTKSLDTGIKIDPTGASQFDRMIQLPDQTILLSLPEQNKIVVATVTG